MDIKYPNIEADLTDSDGDAFAIIAKVRRALRNGGVTASEIDAFTKEAKDGDYDNLLQTCMRWVDVS